LQRLDKYRGFAENEFKNFERYGSIMRPVFDSITSEQEAQSDVRKITETFIRSKIDGGKWNVAIPQLFKRLEFELMESLNLESGEMKAHEMLNRALKEDKITSNEADALYELRNFRNNMMHPKGEKIACDHKMAIEWFEVVFAFVRREEEKRNADKRKNADNNGDKGGKKK
jgi:hypothetical protein